MNLRDLAGAVAARSGLSPNLTEDALSTALDVISAELAAGERVSLPGFGIFEVRDRAARTARNPRTGDPIDVPASRAAAFRPAAALKRRLVDAG